MVRKKQSYNYYRLLIQWVILILIAFLIYEWKINSKVTPDFERFCPFGGIQALISYLKSNILACSMSSVQIVMGIILLFAVLVFSKLFCGYICPLGTITEWLGKAGIKFRVIFSVNGLTDKILRILKYGLLFFTLYFTVISGELFCKKYDPYYALTTWFSGDVDFYYAIAAIIITFIGSIFIRQFWCKYLCPLGAVSNLFSYFFLFLIVILSYVALLYFNFKISWLFPLIILLSISYLLEAFNFNRLLFPLLKIERNDDVCTHCNLCDKACPQGIQISGGNTVITDIDCNLCGNCLTVCSNNSLSINRKKMNWLPASATIILVCLAIYFSDKWEIPTVNERWGNIQDFKTAKTLKKSGLKSIKCYGSCMSFVSQMKNIEGIIGIEAYVNSQSVIIFYNPSIISDKQLNEAIFNPAVYLIKNPEDNINEVTMTIMHVDHFFDSYDNFYLTKLFEQYNGIYGFKSLYGEPVIIEIYYDSQKFNTIDLKNIVESKTISYRDGNVVESQELNFKVSFIEKVLRKFKVIDFKHNMFSPFSSNVNNFEDNENIRLAIYEIEMPEAADTKLKSWLPYLANHLSKDPGIVAFETIFDKNVPIAQIKYVINLTDPNKIYMLLVADSLNITYDDGLCEKEKNPFNFSKVGIIKKDTIDTLPYK